MKNGCSGGCLPTRHFLTRIAPLLVASRLLAQAPASPAIDLASINRAAVDVHSSMLDSTGRVNAIDTFIKLVKIKGPSGEEQAVGEEITRLLSPIGAKPVPLKNADPKAPHNLVMQLPATTSLRSQPALLLNAHIDTISKSTPELLAFDPGKSDFYHRDDSNADKISSFGGDDRSAAAAIIAAVTYLHRAYWSGGREHRRILLVFTAEEEKGCLGAKYLADHEPQLFEKVDLTLAMDGPLDLRSSYPQDAFVIVCKENDRTQDPYKKLIGLIATFCERSGQRFGQTEYGLGMGDFAYFPPAAHAALHLRSPVRGWHTHERIKLQDQINHTDLLCSIVLGWDDISTR
jgi:putative aminopeptidase FrvX